jgi:hypothetical protein
VGRHAVGGDGAGRRQGLATPARQPQREGAQQGRRVEGVALLARGGEEARAS